MRFGTAVNCMDGRVQEPVIAYLKKRFGVDVVDMITDPGPNRILAERKDAAAVASILRRLDISVNHHKSTHIAVVGHHDCAGNPASRREQNGHLREAVDYLATVYKDVEIVKLWVDENWQVHEMR